MTGCKVKVNQAWRILGPFSTATLNAKFLQTNLFLFDTQFIERMFAISQSPI